MFDTNGIGQIPSSLEGYLVLSNILKMKENKLNTQN